MVKKILKWTAAVLVSLLVLILLGSYLSAYFSLDREFKHTQQTSQLPRYSQNIAADDAIELVRITANGFEFRTRIAGNEASRPTVILLHGFPETSAQWAAMFSPLTAAGFRVVAFDQRGYSPGARPPLVSDYAVPNLVADVIAVADAVGAEDFHLIGHDWGAVVGWNVVMDHPDRVLSWTALSIAHPTAFEYARLNDADQQARSSYIGIFTTPVVPETLFTLGDLVVLQGMYGPMSPAAKAEYLAVFSEPKAMTSALNWYRASASLGSRTEQESIVTTPTLFIWGNQDTAAGRAAVDYQEQYLQGPYRFMEINGDHWLMESHGNRIAAVTADFITANQ